MTDIELPQINVLTKWDRASEIAKEKLEMRKKEEKKEEKKGKKKEIKTQEQKNIEEQKEMEKKIIINLYSNVEKLIDDKIKLEDEQKTEMIDIYSLYNLIYYIFTYYL